jgi:hypothetical protein
LKGDTHIRKLDLLDLSPAHHRGDFVFLMALDCGRVTEEVEEMIDTRFFSASVQGKVPGCLPESTNCEEDWHASYIVED